MSFSDGANLSGPELYPGAARSCTCLGMLRWDVLSLELSSSLPEHWPSRQGEAGADLLEFSSDHRVQGAAATTTQIDGLLKSVNSTLGGLDRLLCRGRDVVIKRSENTATDPSGNFHESENWTVPTSCHQPFRAHQILQFLRFTLLGVPLLRLCAQRMQGVSRPQWLKDTGVLCPNHILGKEYAMGTTSEPASRYDGYTEKCMMGLIVGLFVFIFLLGKPTGNLSHQDSTFCYLQATGRI